MRTLTVTYEVPEGISFEQARIGLGACPKVFLPEGPPVTLGVVDVVEHDPEAEVLPPVSHLRELQRFLGVGGSHLVYLGQTGFVIAHTSAERVADWAEEFELTDCDLHQELLHCEAAPGEPGYYIVYADGDWQRFDPAISGPTALRG